MKPYNHISSLDGILKKFAIYLQSQRIHYYFSGPDYDCPNGFIRPINSKYEFRSDGNNLYRIGKGCIIRNFTHMPTYEDIF